MNVETNDAKTEKTLHNLFDEAFELYTSINETTEATNSDSVQLQVKKVITMFENCTRMVSIASIFSNNEDLNEIAPNDVKFLLLPALLGMLHLKLCGSDRKELVDNAEIYFKDFLKRCYEYGLTETNQGELTKPPSENATLSEAQVIEKAVNTRSQKIKRFQEQKELDEQIKYLKQNLDEDVKREFYLKLIKSYIYQAVDELKSIEMERPMLEMFQMRNRAGNRVQRQTPPRGHLKPVIITKDEIQKAVFGLGYPSIPTMTVREFYDKRVADGVFPDPSKVKSAAQMSLQERALAGIEPDHDKEEREEEEKIENDDEENLARMRAKDEYKDEFRRGYGNRMNRS